VKDAAGAAESVTSSPAVVVAGGVPPGLRRIITPVRDVAGGLVHDSAIEVLAGVAVTWVTGPVVTDTIRGRLTKAAAPARTAVEARYE
jgi:hypothetical protein